ncbi:TetR family transcriptional regulator C-terminal domain-containing protein [Cryobacterium sp. 1639]|uniref:TetR/AcrR family transcriptional regulator n=1 Tax=Cryobacterium inferilacus TaxID=2866629 RepID=UPI001C738781|nr:TetR family transcriptional regulator C-terminal domain-containing protein [Cryobacterium sp. 1639]MBX0301071.1 TetR family transcriptional regulator C-terminal domain-containing protein [Cryobacterium sp. 1639]
MTPIRVRVLQAAIDLLATGGLRALTHARIDERAGLPKGSTSNYFRTRDALLIGVADWILAQELTPVRAAFTPRSPAELIDAMCGLLEVTTQQNRDLTAARLVLFLEASHNVELREVLSRGRATLAAGIVTALAELGARDPRAAAETIAACFEGLLLHRIARHDNTDPRPIFATVVAGALA